MQAGKKEIEKRDDFSRKAGEVLREHRVPVDPGVWDALAKKLPPRERRVPAYFPWAVAGVAAALLAVVLLLDPFAENKGVEPLLTRESTSPAFVPPGPEIAAKDVAPEGDTQSIPLHVEPVKKGDAVSITGVIEPGQPQETAVFAELVEPAVQITQKESMDSVRTVKTREREGDVGPTETMERVEVAMTEDLVAESESPVEVEEKQSPRSLIAALGSGGGLSGMPFGGLSGDEASYSDYFPGGELGSHNGSGEEPSNKYNLLTPGDYTEAEHRPPVSFSLMAGIPVTSNLGLEAGVSYTYLFSRFRRNDQFVYRGTLQQHYIGIPVNLRYNVWQKDTWQVYVWGGGNIEKGLWSVYKQEIEHNGGVVHHTETRGRIDGFQFSAQGGAGFSYRLQDNLHLFAEPRLIYYFKNNQPVSARTENPWVFGLGVGIRIQFTSNN